MYTIQVGEIQIINVEPQHILFSVSGDFYRGVNGLQEIDSIRLSTQEDQIALIDTVTCGGKFGCE